MAGVIKLVDIVDRFLFKNKLTKDDYFLYLEHATDCYRDLNIHHGNMYRQAEATASALGVVTMPDDLLDLIGVYVAWRGRRWWFTYDGKLANTFEMEEGEELSVTDGISTGYGATGGKNTYYMQPNWEERVIYLTNMANADCVLVYKTSGIDALAETYVSSGMQEVFDTYLRYQKAILENAPIGIQDMRKRGYDEAVKKYRKSQIPSAVEFRDAIYKTFVQAPYR